MDRIDVCKTELSELTEKCSALLDQGKAEEARALMPRIKDLRANIKGYEEIRAAEESLAVVPPPPRESRAGSGFAELRKAMLEGRSITANGTGINTVSGIVKALVEGGKLRGLVSVFKAANAQSIVPLFSPGLALPVGNAPGATGISADSTAVLGPKTLALKAWYSILGVSNDALLSTDIESELPSIFARAFEGAIDKGIVIGGGSGSDMLGVFVADAAGVPTSSDLDCAATGTPKWVDFVKLASAIIAMGGDLTKAAIVANPAIVSPLLSEATTSTEGLKMELLTKSTIMGIPVIMSGYAPAVLTAGSYVAVGGHFEHYALAVAQELRVDPIRTVGSDVVSFQAFMYMQGSPMIGSSFRRLKTV